MKQIGSGRHQVGFNYIDPDNVCKRDSFRRRKQVVYWAAMQILLLGCKDVWNYEKVVRVLENISRQTW